MLAVGVLERWVMGKRMQIESPEDVMGAVLQHLRAARAQGANYVPDPVTIKELELRVADARDEIVKLRKRVQG